MTTALRHREEGYALLTGSGLEIGALHQPARLPAGCTVSYGDVCRREEAATLFPELDVSSLVETDHVIDLDRDSAESLGEVKFDFVILNHVIEHLANPISAIRTLFGLVRAGGLVVISAPDKEYTFDRPRALTPFEHLLDEYRTGVTEVTDEHYIDFLRAAHPDVVAACGTREELLTHVFNVRRRREHAHVWSSDSFRDFLSRTLDLLEIDAELELEHVGEDNGMEYFSVWRKLR